MLGRAGGNLKVELRNPASSRGQTTRCRSALEAKARLEFDDSPGERRCGASEVAGVADVNSARHRLERRQIKKVESVKEIGAKVEVCLFIDERQLRLFDDGEVD